MLVKHFLSQDKIFSWSKWWHNNSLNLFATSFDQVLLAIFHLKIDLEIHNLI